jgi:hypothetical protein
MSHEDFYDDLDEALLAEDNYQGINSVEIEKKDFDDDDYFAEDDFEQEDTIARVESKLRQSPIVKPISDREYIDDDQNIDSDLLFEESPDDHDDRKTSEPNVDGMTLESYMAQYLPEKKVNEDGSSPDAVDPTVIPLSNPLEVIFHSRD